MSSSLIRAKPALIASVRYERPRFCWARSAATIGKYGFSGRARFRNHVDRIRRHHDTIGRREIRRIRIDAIGFGPVQMCAQPLLRRQVRAGGVRHASGVRREQAIITLPRVAGETSAATVRASNVSNHASIISRSAAARSADQQRRARMRQLFEQRATAARPSMSQRFVDRIERTRMSG